MPDYVIHKDEAGTDRILVATGEIQSTNIQNSIYGVGELFTGGGPILCITSFKNKSATMRIGEQNTKICCFTVSFVTYYPTGYNRFCNKTVRIIILLFFFLPWLYHTLKKIFVNYCKLAFN